MEIELRLTLPAVALKKSEPVFQALKAILADRIRHQGLTDAIEAAQVVGAFKAEVERRFGATAVAAIQRTAFKADTLEVSVGSNALAAELRMRQLELQDALQAARLGKSCRLRIFG